MINIALEVRVLPGPLCFYGFGFFFFVFLLLLLLLLPLLCFPPLRLLVGFL